MDTALVYAQRIKKMTPRLVEIMNRMILGEAPKKIREEFGISSSRFSLIINSPLFKLELRRKLMKREEVILDVQENLLEGAKLGTQLYKDILGGKDGYPTETKLKAANAATSLAVKLLQATGGGGNGGNGNGGEGDGKSYEARLREVTIRESVKTVTSQPQEEFDDLPDEADLLFGEITGEEDFEPTKQIEEILPRKDESESTIDPA